MATKTSALRGAALRGALAAMPRGGRVTSLPVGKPPASTAGLQRLSPGVYRNQQGQLVNSSGGALPGQRPQQQRPQQRPPFQAMPGQQINQAAIDAMNLAQQQQPTWRPPAPLPQDGQAMYYTGGTPNFNELTGMYNQPATQYPGQDYWKSMQGGFGIGQGMVAPQQLSPEQQAYQQALQQQAMQSAQQTAAQGAPQQQVIQSPFYKGSM